MKEITEDYCDFETAKLLKEKGMNESCFKHYVQKNNNDGTSEAVTVCTLQMAMKWLREVHKFHVYITYDGDRGYQPNINNLRTNHLVSMEMYNGFKHEEALETAIVYCLENLI